ncbi:unnamed protein product, partial [Allacma fusca]
DPNLSNLEISTSDEDINDDSEEPALPQSSAAAEVSSLPTVQHSAQPPPQMVEVLINTPRGHFKTQLPQGIPTQVTIPAKSKPQGFIPEILSSKLRPRAKKVDYSDSIRKTSHPHNPDTLLVANIHQEEPANYREAMLSLQKEEWKK